MKTTTLAACDENQDANQDAAKDDCRKEISQPERPYSAIGKYQRIFIITMAAIAALMSPMASQIYYPALPVLSGHYQVSNTLINLSVTVYMIMQALAPSFISGFADTRGRRPAYIICFLIYVAANLGLALQDSYPALMVLRCIQSAGSSATTSLGYAVAADIASPSQRGKYMGVITAGLMAALSLGPFLGGLLVHSHGWRSIFWFLLALSGSYLFIYIITMPETSKSIAVETHTFPSSCWTKSVVQHFTSRCHEPPANVSEHHVQEPPNTRRRSSNPLGSLEIFKDKTASIIILHMGLLYAFQVAVMVSMANSFGHLYGLNTLNLGLCFLPVGIAGCMSSILTGIVMDLNYKRVMRKIDSPSTAQSNGDKSEFPVEKVRLQIALPLLGVVIAGTISYGWIVEHNLPLYVPLVVQGVIGFCGTGFISVLSALLIDLFPQQAATASAAANLVRCCLSGVLAAVLEYLLSAMGWGWCYTLFGLIVFTASPLLGLTYWHGMGWRTRRMEASEI